MVDVSGMGDIVFICLSFSLSLLFSGSISSGLFAEGIRLFIIDEGIGGRFILEDDFI